MFQGVMSNSSLSQEINNNNNNLNNNNNSNNFNPMLLQNTSSSNIISPTQTQATTLPKKVKKKRNLPGNPDPDAEVIALSPKSLLATNRFICEICNKGFQRDQNLQLHRRGHNLPWKLKQRNKLEIVRKKAYVCPEPSCVHHHPSRALGDLTGIKKHFSRKHGEKKFKCDKCSKIYAVHSDWKAHSKTCGTREYRCDCGTLFSRKDSFITHRAFCDALAEESARLSTNPFSNPIFQPPQQSLPPPPPPSFANQNPSHLFPFPSSSSSPWDQPLQNPNNPNNLIHVKSEINNHFSPQSFFQPPPLFSKSMLTSPYTADTNTITAHFLSATALLQKATAVGATLQQSQHSQQALAQTQAQAQAQGQAQAQAQTMLNSFDELGASFHPIPNQTITAPTTTTSNGYQVNYNNNNHQMGGMSFGTWRKSDEVDTTRDFLGLNNNNVVHDDDDMEGNMLKFTGGLHYGMPTPGFDRDNPSPPSPSSSSSVLLKHHHHQVDQGCFGNFVTNEQANAGASSDSRWG